MRRRVILTIYLVLSIVSSYGVNIRAKDYCYPIKGVAGYYSANFGELRPDHFHSGVDIKSDGKQGCTIVAASNGYISRILLSPSGFGLALYIAHPNGTTTVYAHLSAFRDDIAKYVESERYKNKKHSIDLYPSKELFPVKRGEKIALSGNSGSSFGPHLHYEIRESATQRPLNPETLGIIEAKDNIPPTINAIYYVEIDSVAGVAYRAPHRKYEVERLSSGKYRLKGVAKAWVGRCGYFVVHLSDRKNNTSNSYGIYKVDMSLDNRPIYGYQLDSFSFKTSRYINAISDYALSQSVRGELFRLAQLGRGSAEYYHTMVDRGVVGAAAGKDHKILLRVEDDNKNISSLEFTICGKGAADLFKAKIDPKQPIIYSDKEFKRDLHGARITIPAYTLYESIPFTGGVVNQAIKPIEGVELLSPCFAVMDGSVPIHKSYSVEISLKPAAELEGKILIAKVDDKGVLTPAAGIYSKGVLRGEDRRFGKYVAVSDTLAPTITINSADKGEIIFAVKDNFAGVTKYNAELDGEWLAIDLDKERYTITLPMATEGRARKLTITASDYIGNESILSHDFVW